MSQNIKRIYTKITANQCITTPYAMVDGQVSYQPLQPKGRFDIELTEDVRKNRGAILDDSYSLVSKEVAMGQLVENGQLEVTIKLPDVADNAAKTVAKLGLHAEALPHLLADGPQDTKLEIGGTFGDGSLEALGELTKLGVLEMTGIHFDASSDDHYAAKMSIVKFEHDGSFSKKALSYPQSMSNDEQTTIRQMTDFGVKLDGFTLVEMPIYKGVGVNLTIRTRYTRRA